MRIAAAFGIITILSLSNLQMAKCENFPKVSIADFMARAQKEFELREGWIAQLADPQKSIPLLSEALANVSRKEISGDIKSYRESLEILTYSKHELAVPVLIEKIDLELRDGSGRETIDNFMKVRYPAYKAIGSFSPIAIPALMDCLLTAEKDSYRQTNASSAIWDISISSGSNKQAGYYYGQVHRYDEQARILRYLAKSADEFVLQENLLPKSSEAEKPTLSYEQVRSCFEKSLLLWKPAPQSPDVKSSPLTLASAGLTPEQIEKTILELGDLRCEYAIPVLYRYLDFKVTREDGIFYYPAVTALSEFGESATEPLVGQLSQPYQSKSAAQNGISVLVNITGSEAGANEALLKGAEEAQNRAVTLRDVIKSRDLQ